MRTLFCFGLFGWIALMSWSMMLWWQSGFNQAYQSLDTLRTQQAKALSMFPYHMPLKTWFVAQPHVITTLNASPRFQEVMVKTLEAGWQVLVLSLLAIQCLLIKALVFISALPLFCMTALIGLVDGLSQRAIRTAYLGRESSYLFHQLKRYSKQVLGCITLLWFVMPISLAPAWVFIPMSLLLGFLTARTVSHFKKYY